MSGKSFEQFVEEVKGALPSYLPTEFEGAKVEVSTKAKVNINATGISVIPAGEERAVLPLVSLDAFYKKYQSGKSMDEVLSEMSNVFKASFESMEKNPYFDNPMERVQKDRIYMQLINTKSNESLLETLPHREFHDMSIIYRVLMQKDEDGIQSIMVTDELADKLGVDEEELFEIASVQTKELFPVKVDSMANVMRGFFSDESVDIPDDFLEDMGLNDDLGMYIISNDCNVSGATNMVYDDVLFDVANRLGQDLYVLPSSIHEFIAIPSSMGEPEELANMVRDINAGSVSEVDRLSNQVFFYDKDLRELTQVTDTPVLGIKDEEYKTTTVSPFIPTFDVPTEGRVR